MHYIINKQDKIPMTTDMAENLPEALKDFVKDLAIVAERHQSHIEIHADTGIITIRENDDIQLSPTQQVARAIESQWVYDKYNMYPNETIKQIPNKYLSDKFEGSLYIYQYITPEEFQGSIVVLDKDGKYQSTYDELEGAFIPPVEGLDEKAVELARTTFETMTESYKAQIRAAVSQGVIK